MKKLLLLVCLATFFACKKDEKTFNPIAEGVYKSDGRIYSTALTMYTSKGAIIDTGIINTYLKRHDYIPSPFYPGTDHDSLDYRLTFTFNGDSATVLNSKTTGIATYDIVHNKEFISMFVGRDSLVVSGNPSGILDCNNIWYKIGLYAPVYNCQVVPGGSQLCKAKFQWAFARTDDGRLGCPLINYIFSRGAAATSCTAGQFGASLYFNSDVLAELQSADTLIFQTGMFFLSRK